MGKTLEELLAELTPEHRQRIEAGAERLKAQEKTLRELRQAQRLTQQHMAKKLGVKQHSISRLEQRTDMLLSTLRDYIEEMGGQLEIIARLPGHAPVEITGLEDIGGGSRGLRSQARAAKRASSRSEAVPTSRRKQHTSKKRLARAK